MSEHEPGSASRGTSAKAPLWEKMYCRQHFIDLVRLVGYNGLPVAEAQAKIQELKHDKDKLVAAVEELFTITSERVSLKENVRKLAWQLLGPPPGYKSTPIADLIGPQPESKTRAPAKKKSRKAVATPPAGGKPARVSKSSLMEQYREAKQRHPGMLLLFRMGDFYELYGEDAEKAAKILGLTLTTRDKITAMAGFPHHVLEKHLHKLLHSGERVAVMDQVDAMTKDVRREITRVVMPAKSVDETTDDVMEVIGQLSKPRPRTGADGPYAEGD